MAMAKTIRDPAEKAALIAGQIIALGDATREMQIASTRLAGVRLEAEQLLALHFEATVVNAIVITICEPESKKVADICSGCNSVQLRTRMSRGMCLTCAIADRDAYEQRANQCDITQ